MTIMGEIEQTVRKIWFSDKKFCIVYDESVFRYYKIIDGLTFLFRKNGPCIIESHKLVWRNSKFFTNRIDGPARIYLNSQDKHWGFNDKDVLIFEEEYWNK